MVKKRRALMVLLLLLLMMISIGFEVVAGVQPSRAPTAFVYRGRSGGWMVNFHGSKFSGEGTRTATTTGKGNKAGGVPAGEADREVPGGPDPQHHGTPFSPRRG